MTVRGKQYGLRLNCEKSGCMEKFGFLHTDNGEIRILDGPGWQEVWERATVNGHVCDRVTQVIIYEPWLTEEEEKS